MSLYQLQMNYTANSVEQTWLEKRRCPWTWLWIFFLQMICIRSSIEDTRAHCNVFWMVSQQKNKMIFSSILADFEFWIGGSGIFDIFSYSYEDGSCISPWTFFLRRKCPKKAEVSCLTLRRSFEQLLHNSQTLVELFLLLSLNVIKIQVV